MRILILAASNQKARIANKLINSDKISKVLISIGSNKLVNQAQALIVYFETKNDLKKLRDLEKIYQGVPLKFYFGPKNFNNHKHFYIFENVTQMVNDLFTEFAEVEKSASQIYNVLKGQNDKLTVDKMLKGLNENARDVIEEQCVKLFDSKVSDPTKAVVKEKKFQTWWSEGKRDAFEQIKFYLIDQIKKQVQNQILDPQHFNRFQSYYDKHKEIRILKEHFENTFSLVISGQGAAIPQKEEQKTGAKTGAQGVTSKLGGAFGANLGTKMPGSVRRGSSAMEQPVPLGQPQKSTFNLGGGLTGMLGNAKVESEIKKETAQPPKEEKKGTLIDFTVTLFPDPKMDDIVYYNSLHMFSSSEWISIGFKPKAKDLKTIIEDLKTMAHFDNLEDYTTTIVLDGRKVRIGFEGYKIDPFYDKYSQQGEQLKQMALTLEEKQVEAIFEVELSLTQRLDQILSSPDPMIYEIFKGLNIFSSLKFHNKQFSRILETTTEKKYQDVLTKAKEGTLGQEEPKAEEPEEQPIENEVEEKKSEKSSSDSDSSDSDDSDSDDSDSDDSDDDSDDESSEASVYYEEDDDEEEDQDNSERVNLNEVFKYLLPTFLFKWNGDISMEPDLADIKNYCQKNQLDSYLLQSFKHMVKVVNEVDMDETLKSSNAPAKSGTKQEVLNYLEKEIGNEIEISWMTSIFFMKFQIKTDDMSKVIKLLSHAKFL